MQNIKDNINYIETLPDEVILEIMKQLPDKDIPNVCILSKKFSQLCNDEHFWKTKRLETYTTIFTTLSMEGNISDMNEKKKYETMKGLTKIASIAKVKVEDLQNLQVLDLSNNNLSVLPKEIGLLQNLKVLDLHDNNLSVLSKEIAHLQNLQELWLNNNKLYVLPKEIGLLKNLQQLVLSNNNLSEIPKEIGHLKNLQDLFLGNNKLGSTSILPKEIGSLKKLQELYLGNNNLSILPKEIGSLKKLQELYLRNNNLSDDEKRKIRKLLPRTNIKF